MRRLLARNSIFASVLSMCVVFTLLSSFGLHSVQIAHVHPGHVTHDQSEQGHANTMLSVGEYMHIGDKKLFVILSIFTLLATLFSAVPGLRWEAFVRRTEHKYTLFLRCRKEIADVIPEYIRFYFSKGVLHTKLH